MPLPKTIIRPSHIPAPWYSQDIKDAKAACRRAERKWRKTHLIVELELYLSAHQQVWNMCTAAKKSYFQKKIIDCSGDQKALYSMANRLMFKRKCTALPSHTDTGDLAQLFSSYFEQKIANIRAGMSCKPAA